MPTTTPPSAADPPRPAPRAVDNLATNPHGPASRAANHLAVNPHGPASRAEDHLTANLRGLTSRADDDLGAGPGKPDSRDDSGAAANRRGSAGRARRDLAALLIATLVSWMGQRITAIALPLVALAQTGNVWTTGLVAGAAGLPLLTSGWWAGRLRHHITDGPALALTQAVQTLGLLVVPVAALWVPVSAVHLGVCGLLSGAAAALAGPARQALTADVADRLGPGAAARALAWQDLAHRASMVVAPPLAAAAVAASGPMPLLWCEAAGLATAALTITGVRSPRRPPTAAADPPVRMRAVLRRHAELRQALVMSGAGGGAWFAFVLGLAVLGAQTGRPGVLIAAGLTGYGAGSITGALAAPALSTRLPALPTAATSWIILGLAFLAIAAAGSPLLIAALSAIGGAAMPIGIAAVNALISTRTAGAERRAAFATDSVVHDGAATLGMLAGGAVIGLAGARPTLAVAGLLQVAVAVAVLIRWCAGGSGAG